MIEDGSISLSVALAAVVVALVIGVLSGASFARRGRRPLPRPTQGGFLRGLDALVDEPTEQAVDTLLLALDVDDDTVDTHLALGSLVRRRGEIGKALRLHQNLLARPRLSREHRSQAQLELARDFLAAGQLDRAGRLLEELSRAPGAVAEAALADLLEVRERERAWADALATARRLLEIGDRYAARHAAHALCELAEQALDAGDAAAARANAADALDLDPACVRASLLLGSLAAGSGRWREAIDALSRVRDQDARFVVEALPGLLEAHRELGAERDLARLLERWQAETPSTAVACALAEISAARAGAGAAREELAAAVSRAPTLRALVELLDRQGPVDDALGDAFTALRGVVRALLADAEAYRCTDCGALHATLRWQCPACRTWGSTTPRQGLLGD